MTVRLRPNPRARRRRSIDSEDRFQFWVTVGFIALIVLVGLILLIAVALGFYNQHFKPIATVGSTNITRDQWADRINLERYRLQAEEQRIRAQITAHEIDASLGEALINDNLQKQDAATLATQSANNLLDLIFKEQLAGANEVTASDDDINAQMVKDASGAEERHVLAIVIEPKGVGGGSPTTADNQTAYENAQKAAAALAAGTPFDQVAQQYNTDDSKDKGGDLGYLLSTDTTDVTWVDALFRLPVNGTTPVIKGDDGVFRIGRVTEIKPGVEDTAFRAGAEKAVGADAYRQQIRREALADKLSDKIVAQALDTAVDQYHLQEVFISIAGSDPTTDEQIHASHILYSPKDDPSGAASLAPEDPSWADALAAATKTATELNGITDVSQREARFAEIAKAESDDKVSGADGGDLGFFPRDQMVAAFSDALFPNTSLQAGDIVGPVKSDFGYHVILFWQRKASATARLKNVTDALAAPSVDFGALAKLYSDGDEAQSGGDRGWKTLSQLPDDVGKAVAAVAVGGTTASVQTDDGFYIEKVLEKATRKPEGMQASTLAAHAFDAWYADQKKQAVQQKIIVTDSSIFTSSGS